MNNVQLYLTIGIPTFTVVLAWLTSLTANSRTNDTVSRTNEKIDRLATELRAEISSMRAEIVALRIDHHKDNLALMGYMVPLHERMAKLESRS